MNIHSFLNFKIFFRIFILSIIFLLLDGFYYFYYNKIMDAFGVGDFKAQSGFNPIIWNENGFVENLQVFFLIVSIIFVTLFINKQYNNLKKLEKLLILIYIFAINYYLFEEISWGQHIFNWESPDFISKINHQNETNIHNISSVFNELPRNLLLLWCGITFLWIDKITLKNQFLRKFIFPNVKLKYISYLIIFFFIPNFIVSKLDLFHDAFFHIISFNFVRLSELEELIFNFYILNHSFYLFKSKI